MLADDSLVDENIHMLADDSPVDCGGQHVVPVLHAETCHPELEDHLVLLLGTHHL